MTRLAFTFLAFAFLAGPAMAVAQKPVVTRNADEPGRAPYQQSLLFQQSATNCPNQFYCVVNFVPVPAGYRLVITYASARFDQGVNAPARASLGLDGDLFGQMVILPNPSVGPTTSYATGGAMTFYVDAGHSPSMFFGGYSLQSTNSAAAAVVGYLVAVP